ncbi:MAG: hypothetical protein M1837_003956 [Sclerophora amabilis]|nr:MAG: hypothetical protein M1837_003956 [Sclerophora amabilis]
MAGKDSMLVDKRPVISRLSPGTAFDSLTPKEKLYAHHMARAAWHGTRIILRQVSPESAPIFDFILELYRVCDGDWSGLARQTEVSSVDLSHFLEFAAVFLANIGNYYGHGDQKFNPKVTTEFLEKVSSVSLVASELHKQFAEVIVGQTPSSLGFPSDVAQSSYYPGTSRMSREEIAEVSRILENNSIHPENTRILKFMERGVVTYDVLQGSIELDSQPRDLDLGRVRLVRGDHAKELELICDSLEEAREYAANRPQKKFTAEYQRSFRSGDIEAYKESQKTWVKDFQPAVETIFGFVEPYRDPFGVRAEFEGLVAVVHKEETKMLETLVENSSKFIQRLPWAENMTENDGKGPFEKASFENPDFTSLHNTGFKNVMITNSMSASKSDQEDKATCVHESEAAQFSKHKDHAFYLWVVFHELLGHGTGKLLAEEKPGSFNFDIQNPPINPLTRRPVESWYRPGQTWTGLFGDIATSVDECRAECVGAYLMSDMELLAMFGYSDETEITGKDLEYNMYMQLGVAGLRALQNYILEDYKWGQAHSRAHFAMFKCLLAAGDEFLRIEHNTTSQQLTVFVDSAKIATHGKPAIARLLLRLHIYRCTADVEACRRFYEEITKPEGKFLDWRRIMLANQPAKQIFVQPNTFVENGQVILKEYDTTVEGMIQSWAERRV